ncbi:MAG: transporter, family, arabinose polymer transporter [Hydrocarboniphaga sp.]|uniref:MFS transporter n=1 Tax=Hydrocarboniphaga sp. TaxID=2033016 RepID=UPI00261AA417|nr:MFS transporter [Hydrocarboniphaga sp.]MDB5970802.1 transporter, family, arabinose polymer transporter [Hydrocarboniphaga sp.]
MPSWFQTRLPLLALAIAAFAIGTTEFVIMGLLPQIAADLGVTIPRAGLLVTGYAMGVVVGGPILVLLLIRIPQKSALLLLMSLFTLGNLACALSPNYAVLMLARFIAAFSHGSFFGIAAVVATRIVPEREGAQAVGLMFAGLTIANIVGVPLGAMLGEAYGWRATFWAVVALGLVAAAGITQFVPKLSAEAAPSLRRELAVLRRPQVLLALCMTVFGFGGVFTVFTFVVPILRDAAGVPPNLIAWVLMLFGAGATLGTLAGGRIADRGVMQALSRVLISLIAFYALFPLLMNNAITASIGVFLVGALGFAAGPGLQTRCMQQAQGAPLLASTMNQSAFNLGNAGGAYVGAVLLGNGASYHALPWAAALITVLGLGLTTISWRMERRSKVGPRSLG